MVFIREFERFFFFYYCRDVYNDIFLWDKENNNMKVNYIILVFFILMNRNVW